MSEVHLRHIKKLLQDRYVPLVDCSDFQARGREAPDHTKLSRALAAFALAINAELEPADAVECIVDGFQDNGLDAIYSDEPNACVYFVQSKWTEGAGGIDLGEVGKVIQGLRDYYNGEFNRFNQRVLDRADTFQAALERPDTKYELLLVSTSPSRLSQEAKRLLDEYVARVNDAGEVLSWRHLTQSEIHRAVAKTADARPIDLEILLHEWGQVASPIRAFYGQVSVADVAAWWNEHRHQLFSKNLRSFLGNSTVNDAIAETLIRNPERFWYLNNGLTILCDDISKKALGGDLKTTGIFVCRGVAIVNGAQTVGSIGRTRGEGVGNARVMVRIISLAQAQAEFASEVTRATNTQNRIEARDFAALDPEQQRLKAELAFEGITYVYRSGEPTPTQGEGCDIEEATVALACAASDLGLSVQAKGGVGRLWGDITTAPYKLLFNRSLTGARLWGCVQILRRVEATLRSTREESGGRFRQLAVHGNRFIARQVFRAVRGSGPPASPHDIEGLTFAILEDLDRGAETTLQGVYVGAAFKTPNLCEELERALFSNIAAEPQRPVSLDERTRRARARAIPRQLSLFGVPEPADTELALDGSNDS